MRRKAFKKEKNLESSPFWNPESTELESGIQYSESGIHRVESRIQDCHGFPYMGRQVTEEKLKKKTNEKREKKLYITMKARWPKHYTTPSLFLLATFTFIAHNSPCLLPLPSRPNILRNHCFNHIPFEWLIPRSSWKQTKFWGEQAVYGKC